MECAPERDLNWGISIEEHPETSPALSFPTFHLSWWLAWRLWRSGAEVRSGNAHLYAICAILHQRNTMSRLWECSTRLFYHIKFRCKSDASCLTGLKCYRLQLPDFISFVGNKVLRFQNEICFIDTYHDFRELVNVGSTARMVLS